MKAAYDYRSFGEQVTLAESADKVTENFTGKEKDDETELNYFGARYLDPMLGVWTSVDPMRQFSSPYLYAGNGYNPVNAIDPDRDILKMHSRNSEAYNKKAEEAIDEIEKSGENGKAFIEKLRNSKNNVVIKQTSKGNTTRPTSFFWRLKNFFGIGNDAEVNWNPDVTKGGTNTEGNRDRPNFIGLAHELGHSEDIVDGTYSTDDGCNADGIPFKEENSMKRENQIRKDVGEPLREKY